MKELQKNNFEFQDIPIAFDFIRDHEIKMRCGQEWGFLISLLMIRG